MNAGQICMSTEKVVVDQAVADDFVARFAAAVGELRTGKPTEEVHVAACVDRATVDHVAALLDDAMAKGAKVLTGGEVPATGAIMTPTVVDRVTPDMRLYGEESFGPIAAVIRARDTEHAIEIANDTEYGLSSAVFGQDIRRAMSVAARIEAGICHINGATVADEAQMPFGGVKASGYGHFGSDAAVEAFTQLRWITIEDPAQPYPI